MTCLVYYVVRQRGGWGVEYDGLVRSGHSTREAAIESAKARAGSASSLGQDALVRIQDDSGAWREERSFSPAG